nr:MAG TPA: hypothetical protein [Caudoviricetes sp.]
MILHLQSVVSLVLIKIVCSLFLLIHASPISY